MKAPEPSTLENAVMLAYIIRAVLPGESISRARWTVNQATARWNAGSFQRFLDERWGETEADIYFGSAEKIEIVRRYTIHQLER